MAGWLPERLPARSDVGAVINYSLFGGSIRDMRLGHFQFNGANASLDARVFGPNGVISQTGIVGPTLYSSTAYDFLHTRSADFLRLDTTYTYFDPGRALTYRVGDAISGSVNWSRPIRLAGLHVTSDFTLRSDE